MDDDYEDINKHLVASVPSFFIQALGKTWSQDASIARDELAQKVQKIMHLQFMTVEMTAPFLLNEHDTAWYKTLKRRKDFLPRQLYRLMKAHNDIWL